MVYLFFSIGLFIFSTMSVLVYVGDRSKISSAYNVFAQELAIEDSENNGVLGLKTAVSSNIVLEGQVKIERSDIQGYLFDEYLRAQKSPLAGHGDDFVQACRLYGAPKDCTLLLAIAKVETNFCKTDISAIQHNCWGFGGSPPNRIIYGSFPEAIDSITSRLMSGYGTRFFEDPRYGGLTYCGAHCVNWGKYVLSEQTNIKAYLAINGWKAN